MIKKTTYSLLFLLVCLGFGHLYYFWTGDFRISYVLHAETSLSLESGIIEPKIKDLLRQNYSYLGSGHQVYAFLGEDKSTVLKLFKRDYFQSTPWIHVFPPIPPFRDFFLSQGTRREYKKNTLLNGYANASKFILDESGLLYFHPFESDISALKTILITGFNFKYTIDLNDYVFAIQIKVIPTKEVLNALLFQGKVDEAKMRIRALFGLYLAGYKKGIVDHDYNFLDNTGFDGDRAIRQDVGRIFKEPKPLDASAIQRDWNKIVIQRLAPWLKKKYPQYADEILKEDYTAF